MGLSTPLLRGEDRVSGARGESCCQMRPSQRHHPQSGGGRKVEARARCGAGAHRLQEQDTQDTPASSTRQRSRCARCQSRVNVVTLQ